VNNSFPLSLCIKSIFRCQLRINAHQEETRTSENLKDLGQNNLNASENSPHLNGNAFDISYARFSMFKLHVTECDKWYMKEALAEVIWQLRQEKKCWAKYELQQGCFHVVSR